MDLVKIENNQVVTTSLIIANGVGVEHESAIRLIDKYSDKFNSWGQIEFSVFKSGNPEGGRPIKVAILNEQQATFLVTLFRNNVRVVAFKTRLVDQFYKMRDKLRYGSDKVPQTFLEALELAVEKEKQRLAFEQQYLLEKERADEYQSTHELYESVTNKGGWISAKTVTDVLNILGLGRTNFYRFLREQGIVTNKNQPMRCHIETKLMKARYDDFLEQYIVEFSFKGLKYIYAKLVQAKKIPSDLSEETWIKYCVDMETNEGDNNEIY